MPRQKSSYVATVADLNGRASTSSYVTLLNGGDPKNNELAGQVSAKAPPSTVRTSAHGFSAMYSGGDGRRTEHPTDGPFDAQLRSSTSKTTKMMSDSSRGGNVGGVHADSRRESSPSSEELAKLLLNLKLLKESLCAATTVGTEELLRELKAETSSSSSSSSGGSDQSVSASQLYVECTWVVKRAMSELHVMHNRRMLSGNDITSHGGSGRSGADGSVERLAAEHVAAELALCALVTDCRLKQVATEKKLRRATERQAAQAAAMAGEHAAEHAAREELARLEGPHRAALQAAQEAAARARREGEVASERLAERLAKAEGRAQALEAQLSTHAQSPGQQQQAGRQQEERGAQAGPQPAGPQPAGPQTQHAFAAVLEQGPGAYPPCPPRKSPGEVPVPPSSGFHSTPTAQSGGWSLLSQSGGGKDRRLAALEKQVGSMRRKETELASSNAALEAKCERLQREIKGCRPAGPGSKAKVEELAQRCRHAELRAKSLEAEVAEARAMQGELSTQVASLSVARAERDASLQQLRLDLAAADKAHARAAAEAEAEARALGSELRSELSAAEARFAAAQVASLAAVEAERARAAEAAAASEAQFAASLKQALLEAAAGAEASALLAAREHDKALGESDAEWRRSEELRGEEAGRLNAELSKAAKERESALRAMEDELEAEHTKQLDQARSYCERLRAEAQEGSEERAQLLRRVREVTGKLNESQSARVELQVRAHELSVAAEDRERDHEADAAALRAELSTQQKQLSTALRQAEAAGREREVAGREEVSQLRAKVGAVRHLEAQVEALLLDQRGVGVKAMEMQGAHAAVLRRCSELEDALRAAAKQTEQRDVDEEAKARWNTETKALQRQTEARQAGRKVGANESNEAAGGRLGAAEAAEAAALGMHDERGATLEAHVEQLQRHNESLRGALRALDGRCSNALPAPSMSEGGQAQTEVLLHGVEVGCVQARSKARSKALGRAATAEGDAARGGESSPPLLPSPPPPSPSSSPPPSPKPVSSPPEGASGAPSVNAEGSSLAFSTLARDLCGAQEALEDALGTIRHLERSKAAADPDPQGDATGGGFEGSDPAAREAKVPPAKVPPAKVPPAKVPVPDLSSPSPAPETPASYLSSPSPEVRAAAAAAALAKARASASVAKCAMERRIGRLEEELGVSQARERDATHKLAIARKNIARKREASSGSGAPNSSGSFASDIASDIASGGEREEAAVPEHFSCVKGKGRVPVGSVLRRGSVSSPPPYATHEHLSGHLSGKDNVSEARTTPQTPGSLADRSDNSAATGAATGAAGDASPAGLATARGPASNRAAEAASVGGADNSAAAAAAVDAGGGPVNGAEWLKKQKHKQGAQGVGEGTAVALGSLGSEEGQEATQPRAWPRGRTDGEVVGTRSSDSGSSGSSGSSDSSGGSSGGNSGGNSGGGGGSSGGRASAVEELRRTLELQQLQIERLEQQNQIQAEAAAGAPEEATVTSPVKTTVSWSEGGGVGSAGGAIAAAAPKKAAASSSPAAPSQEAPLSPSRAPKTPDTPVCFLTDNGSSARGEYGGDSGGDSYDGDGLGFESADSVRSGAARASGWPAPLSEPLSEPLSDCVNGGPGLSGLFLPCHGLSAAAACESVWGRVAEVGLRGVHGHGALGASWGSTRRPSASHQSKVTIAKLFASEFDRAKTGRNTSTQFSQGLARIGVKHTSAEGTHVFKDMLVSRKKKMSAPSHSSNSSISSKSSSSSASSSSSSSSPSTSSTSSSSPMLDSTVNALDVCVASARWLAGRLDDADLASLGLPTIGDYPLDALPKNTQQPSPRHPGAASMSPSRRSPLHSANKRAESPGDASLGTPQPKRDRSPLPNRAPQQRAQSGGAGDADEGRFGRGGSSGGFGSSGASDLGGGVSRKQTAALPMLDDPTDKECTFQPRLESKQSFRASMAERASVSSSLNQQSGLKPQRASSPQAPDTYGRRSAPGSSVSGGGGGGSGNGGRRTSKGSAVSGSGASLRSHASNPLKQTLGSASRVSRESQAAPEKKGKGAHPKLDPTFDLTEALGKVVGQAQLKQQLLAFERGIELQARRKALGIECDGQWPPHMMFVGNPGTGKTTIARLVGLILKKLGALPKGHLVEVQRSDLVAGAIGQTALKTREKIKEATGGVLFVDEAYTLAPGSSSVTGECSKDFGREAINEIMSCMNSGDPVVIFAGYGAEMAGFVRSNAGLFRRIDVRYDFANYACGELACILRREVEEAGFSLCPATVDTGPKGNVASLLGSVCSVELREAMNGGLARQLFRKARGELDKGLSLTATHTPTEMCTLTLAHLEAALVDIAAQAPPPPRPSGAQELVQKEPTGDVSTGGVDMS